MTRIVFLVVAALLGAACSPKPEAALPRKAEPPAEPLKATVWTEKGELYLEYPPLVVNQPERFAIHLTRLTDFKAVKEATCEVRLSYGSDPAVVFPCDPSTHPGIFGANVQPRSAGEARLQIRVQGKELDESFNAGAVQVAAERKAAEVPGGAGEETINFTKEQQWSLDFATQVVREESLRDNLRVAAETLPRTGGQSSVIAPLAGRLVADKIYPAGTAVAKGAELGNIVPPTSAPSDLATLELAETEAKVRLEQARRDHQRARRLLAAGAAPARREEEASAAEATAQARLEAAQTRLAQYEATRTADGVEAGSKGFLLRAPISGIVSQADAVNGSQVERGQVLFRIVDADALFVSGVVPESEYGRLRQLSGAEIEMPDGQIRRASRLVSVGRLVNPETRTVAVVYEVDNRDRRLAVNQTVFLRLLLSTEGTTSVVPETALVDDGGRPIVFVQRAGESFARRPVKLGIRNGGKVQILDGVKAGERVVTRGAYLIRLASMSSQVPAHGHVH